MSMDNQAVPKAIPSRLMYFSFDFTQSIHFVFFPGGSEASAEAISKLENIRL